MNFSMGAIAAGLIYGAWGIYLIKKAKRESSFLSLIFGVVLVAYPYFIENIYLLWGIGAVICVAEYKLADL